MSQTGCYRATSIATMCAVRLPKVVQVAVLLRHAYVTYRTNSFVIDACMNPFVMHRPSSAFLGRGGSPLSLLPSLRKLLIKINVLACRPAFVCHGWCPAALYQKGTMRNAQSLCDLAMFPGVRVKPQSLGAGCNGCHRGNPSKQDVTRLRAKHKPVVDIANNVRRGIAEVVELM